jgi:hypothetical protein
VTCGTAFPNHRDISVDIVKNGLSNTSEIWQEIDFVFSECLELKHHEKWAR